LKEDFKMEKKCFVISPIGEEGSEIRKNADDALEFVIEPACGDYEIIRSDKISDNGIITQSIVENILKCDLAIADLTGRNPNVFYELAIRHSYGLPVIQITRDDVGNLPFDIHNVRTIQYDLSASGAKKASIEIKKIVDGINNGNNPLNPVTSVAGILNIDKKEISNTNDTMSELLLKVNNIPDRLNQLEINIGVRFSQMLTAFGETMKTGSSSPNSVQDMMMQKFFETLMNNPKQGIDQINNLLVAQKYMEEKGIIKKDK